MASSDKFIWVDQDELAKPKEGHALICFDLWCVVNKNGKVAVFQPNKNKALDMYVQGNKHKSIAEKLAVNIPGAEGVIFVPLIIMKDSPSRYY